MGLGGSEEEDGLLGLLRRGDSGGGVSQPISDTGEPFFTYGVASRMYFTENKRKDRLSVVKTLRTNLKQHTDLNVMDIRFMARQIFFSFFQSLQENMSKGYLQKCNDQIKNITPMESYSHALMPFNSLYIRLN